MQTRLFGPMRPDAADARDHRPIRPTLPNATSHDPHATAAAAHLDGLPRSARVVYDALQRLGALTHRDLLALTPLPGRTVRYAVSRLREAGLVENRPSLRDARQSYYVPAGRFAPAAAVGVTTRARAG